jgi:hypothetical protein
MNSELSPIDVVNLEPRKVPLRQWGLRVNAGGPVSTGRLESLFTPQSCDGLTARAIASATFGEGVSDLTDAGVFDQVVR